MPELHVHQVLEYEICPRMYRYGNVDRLVPLSVSPKLQLGTGFHLGVGAYYLTGDPARADAVCQVWADDCRAEREDLGQGTSEHDEEAFDHCRRLVASYIEFARQHDNFKVVSVEQEFITALWGPDGRPLDDAYYVGTFDGVVRDSYGVLHLMEHKTARSFPSESQLRLDRQVGFYLLAASQLFNEPVGYVIYNVVQKTSGNVQRYRVTRTPRQLQDLCYRLHRAYERIRSDKAFDPIPGFHCDWRCAYKPLCLAEEEHADVEFLVNTQYRRKEDDRPSWLDRLKEYLERSDAYYDR